MAAFHFQDLGCQVSGVGFNLLGGSWAVISRVISRVTIIITRIRGLMTPLITTLNPQSPNPKPYRTLKGPLKEP